MSMPSGEVRGSLAALLIPQLVAGDGFGPDLQPPGKLV